MCATPLPVQSEMLFTRSAAPFASPQEHELALSADPFTLVRDNYVSALLDGRLRGVIISGLGNSGTFTCTVRLGMQMYWITESMLFSSCMSVDPSTEDSGTPVSLTAFMK